MDTLQVVALVLELLGFGLTALHIFRDQFDDIAHLRILWFRHRFFSHTGVYDRSDAANPSVTDLDRKAKRVSNAILLVLFVVASAVLLLLADLGAAESIPSLAFLIIVLVFLGGLVAAVVQALLALIVTGVVKLLVVAGKGNVVAGVGLTLAAVGILIETLQVWQTRFKWLSIALLSLFVAVWVVVMFSSSRAKRIT